MECIATREDLSLKRFFDDSNGSYKSISHGVDSDCCVHGSPQLRATFHPILNICTPKAVGLTLAMIGSLFWLLPASAQGKLDCHYKSGLGTVIRIYVFQHPDIPLETRVSESGEITYSLIGSEPIVGLAIDAAERRIAQGLREDGNIDRISPDKHELIQPPDILYVRESLL